MPDSLPTDTSASMSHRTERLLCFLLCCAALLAVSLRIATIRSATGEVPFLSANDRSRWATVAALVDRRTYSIDALQNYRDPQTKRRTWQTIDRVQHRDNQGVIRNYSSKPPLLATLIAIPYSILKTLTGWSFVERPFLVGRILLALVNLPLMALLMACMVSLIRHHGQGATTRLTLTAMMALGTFLTPFAVTLNNHLPAATATAAVLWLLDTQARRGPTLWKMLGLGVALGFAVANELPALAIVPCALFLAYQIHSTPTSRQDGGRWRFFFRPQNGQHVWIYAGLLLVAIPFFTTNYIAHQSFRPPYAHRGLGSHIETLALPQTLRESLAERLPTENRLSQNLLASLTLYLADHFQLSPDEVSVSAARHPETLRLDIPGRTLALHYPSNLPVSLRNWDDWYDYPGTYWTDSSRKGIDVGEPSRLRYAFHVLVGHHGIFSLTPFWCISLASALTLLVARTKRTPDETPGLSPTHSHQFLYLLQLSIIAVTSACLFFYLSRPLIDRNYGGVSTCLRWLLWLAPLWIFISIPLANRLTKFPTGRYLLWVLVLLSIASAATGFANPWSHPWLYRWLQAEKGSGAFLAQWGP